MSKAQLSKDLFDDGDPLTEIHNRLTQLEKDLRSGLKEVVEGIKILIDLVSD